MVIKAYQTDNSISFSTVWAKLILVCVSRKWTDNKIPFSTGQTDNSTYPNYP